jgi:DMSO reductase anchor subunit
MRLTVTVILLALATITVETFSVEPNLAVFWLAVGALIVSVLHLGDQYDKQRARRSFSGEVGMSGLRQFDGEWPWPTRGEWKP